MRTIADLSAMRYFSVSANPLLQSTSDCCTEVQPAETNAISGSQHKGTTACHARIIVGSR